MPTRGRSLQERLADALLLLFLIDDANQKGGAGGITKLEKLVFLSELDMLRAHEKGFNYSFVKLERGPYSSEIEKTDIPKLERLGYLSRQAEKYVVTKEGVRVLQELSSLFDLNQRYAKTIRKINAEYSGLFAGQLVDLIHEMPPPYRRAGRTINDVPHRAILLKRIADHTAESTFAFTESELATLEFYFDPEARKSAERALRSAASEPSLAWEEVLGRASEEPLQRKNNTGLQRTV